MQSRCSASSNPKPPAPKSERAPRNNPHRLDILQGSAFDNKTYTSQSHPDPHTPQTANAGARARPWSFAKILGATGKDRKGEEAFGWSSLFRIPAAKPITLVRRGGVQRSARLQLRDACPRDLGKATEGLLPSRCGFKGLELALHGPLQ